MIDAQNEKINWFVGHMQKSMRDIQNTIKRCDLIIHIVDARCVHSSINDELVALAKDKPVLNLALKADLDDASKRDPNFSYLNANDPKFRINLINLIKQKLKPKYLKLKEKGLVNPHFYLLCIGLPNTGKSTLINKLSGQYKMKVENRPGVTRAVQAIKINNSISVYDSPGILIKDIRTIETGLILGTIGCINPRVLPIERIVRYNCDYYFKVYEKIIRDYFNYQEPYDFYKFIDHVAKKQFFIGKNNVLDINRAYIFLFGLFRESKICKCTYEEKIVDSK
ncbi:MAG: ribosome biogenesis GTPase YlqF [Mycoplasma sp.]